MLYVSIFGMHVMYVVGMTVGVVKGSKGGAAPQALRRCITELLKLLG